MSARSPITPDTRIKRNPDVVWSSVDDESVILCIETGKYYGLDSISTRIWELLEKPSDINTLCEILLNEYDVEDVRCREEVTILLQKLCRLGLTHVSNAVDAGKE